MSLKLQDRPHRMRILRVAGFISRKREGDSLTRESRPNPPGPLLLVLSLKNYVKYNFHPKENYKNSSLADPCQIEEPCKKEVFPPGRLPDCNPLQMEETYFPLIFIVHIYSKN